MAPDPPVGRGSGETRHADPFQWGAGWQDVAETVRGGRSGLMPPFAEALSEAEIRSVSFLGACWVERRDP